MPWRWWTRPWGGRHVLEPYVSHYDAVLLADHGAVAVGPSLGTAPQRIESTEHAARIVLAARLVGRVNELTAEQATALVAARAVTANVQSRSTARTSRREKA